ncbi:MAG: tetratricopeptide repeat protein [Ignavibacteriaceae bacterium]|nr:tetratricopeptide repeat protein [Ignavibacteriaceae bacterium]
MNNCKIITFFLSAGIFLQVTYAQLLPSAGHLKIPTTADYSYLFKKTENKNISQLSRNNSDFALASGFYQEKNYSFAKKYYQLFLYNSTFSLYRPEALYRLAFCDFFLGNYSESREIFGQLVAQYPSYYILGEIHHNIAESYRIEKNYRSAIEWYQAAIQNKTTNPVIDKSYFALGICFEEVSEYQKAIDSYEKILSYYSDSEVYADAQIRLGFNFYKINEYERSIIELSNPSLKNIELGKKAEYLFFLGDSYFHSREYESAARYFEEIVETYPDFEFIRDVRYALAWTHLEKKDYTQAFKEFSLLAQGSDSIALLSTYWKGESIRNLGNLREAIKIFEDFQKRFPSSSYIDGVLFQIGKIYFELKQNENATKYLLNLLNQTRNQELIAHTNLLLGDMEFSNRNYQIALKYYDNARNNIKERFSVFKALLGYGISLHHLKQYDQSIAILSVIDSLAPNFESGLTNFYLAENYFKKENYLVAHRYYGRVSSDDETIYSTALYSKAYCLFNMRDYNNASYVFQDFLKMFPKDSRGTDVRLRLADALFSNKGYEEALRNYDILLSSKDSKNQDYILYQTAQVFYKLNRMDRAQAQLNTLIRSYSRSQYLENAYYLSGWIYFQERNYERAIEKYRELIYRVPKSKLVPTAYYSIGDSYYNAGNFTEAISAYEKVIRDYRNSPNWFDAVNGLQYCYVALGDIESAAKILNDYALRNKQSGFSDQLFIKKGELYYSNRDYANARASYYDFINIYSGSKLVPEAYYWAGKSSQNLGEFEEAKQNFNLIISRYPGSDFTISAVIDLASIYESEGSSDKAISLFNRIIKSNETSKRLSELMFLKAKLLQRIGDMSGAYDLFEEITQSFEDNVFSEKSKLELGRIEFQSGRFENAIRLLQKLANTRNDDIGAEAQFILGNTFLVQKKTEDAITAFVRVINIFFRYEEWVKQSYLALGSIYEQKKDTKKAKEMYQVLVNRKGTDDYTNEAKNRLKRIR